MGKLDLFSIVITNRDAVCRAGEKVTGYVLVTLNADMKMRGILLSFKGNAHVKWTVRRSNHTDTYKATENYFDEQHVLFKPVDGTEVLPQGEHRFDFQYQLPTNLPSTFEGEYGYVRYYIKGRIDRPWKFDHTVKEVFTVLSILDLNSELESEEPVHLQHHSDSFSCCCMKDGEGTLTLKLPRRGFVPGEHIPVTVHLQSTVPEQLTLTVELNQYIMYKAKGRVKEKKEVVASLTPVAVQPRQSYSYTRQTLHIPAIPPSRLVHCDIIDIMYMLKVKATTGWFEVKTKSDIIVGTVPLRSVVDMYRTPPMTQLDSVVLEPSAPAFPAPEPYPAPAPTAAGFDMPPPSYAECVFGKASVRDDDDDQYTMGPTNYAPRYTYYTWT